MPESNLLVPPGPPAPTGKTLAEIQPGIPINETTAPGDETYVHRIPTSRRGRYFLTGDVMVPAGMGGIFIPYHQSQPNLILDLNGFAIRGDDGSRAGVYVSGVHQQVIVCKGTIEGVEVGVNAPGHHFGAISRRFEKLLIRNCSADGIRLSGGNNTIRRCMVWNCGGHGIVAPTAVIDLCSVHRCAFSGFSLGGGVHVRHCMAIANGTSGFGAPDSSGSGCTFSDCLAMDNNQYGFDLKDGSIAERCLATRNKSGGFQAVGARLTRNLARRNGPDGNGTAAGILVTNSCVVEDNYCVGNERGIVATGAHNLIQRNACSGNGTNWVVASGNTANVIVAAKSPSSDEAPNGVPLGSSDPLVNYTF